MNNVKGEAGDKRLAGSGKVTVVIRLEMVPIQ
jgi:hypothetical protein